MSFDQDPQDTYKRILCYHAESDCIFIVNSQAEFDHCCNAEPIDDVTGIEKYEKAFREEGCV